MSLHITHRPKTFEEVRGNTEIVEALTNMLADLKKCPHSFMFAGPTGCGKTTLGRIIADKLGCRGSDYKEINSADIRGIDGVREIIKQSQYKPLEGSCRVWLIDECHKMTGDAQNALLKILEDTPSHIYFILCTTDPNKVISAVKGRCSIFTVTTLNEKQIIRVLKKVVVKEGETLENEVYEQIAQDSLGHVRNALQILEQVLAVDPKRRLETARRSAEEQSQSIELCRALLGNKGWKEVSAILNGLKDQDAEGVRRHVMGYCQAVLLKGDVERAGLILEQFLEPFYNTGFPGLIYACYSVVKN